jgi:acetylornithine deacetylase
MSASSPTFTPPTGNAHSTSHASPPGAPALADDAQFLRLLSDGLKIDSTSGREATFVLFIEAWAKSHGLATELFQADEASLARYPQSAMRHLPLAGRPTLIVRVPGRAGAPSLLFNAHSDVVGPGDPAAWTHGPFSGHAVSARVFGRGACDTKGPLVAALWAMTTIASAGHDGGDVTLELIPGEEDCIGLGTLTSVAHGVTSDSVIILEPTEGLPRCASRAGCRFEITARGRAVHGTVKWLGRDALALIRRVLAALDAIEARFNDRTADARFASYPIARPITVDALHGVGEQGMIADSAVCQGYLELLPNDDRLLWKSRLIDELKAELGPDAADVAVAFTEEYDGHSLGEDRGIYQAAAQVAGLTRLEALNSGCEAGLRASLLGSPTLVWGPGSLAQAHAADEFVDFGDVRTVAARFVEMIALCTAAGRP